MAAPEFRAGQIRITDRSGASATIDLRYANSASDVVDAINTSTDIRVAAMLDGDRFTLIDSSGGSGTLSVSEVGSGVTARDLGLSSISTSNVSASGSDCALGFTYDCSALVARWTWSSIG